MDRFARDDNDHKQQCLQEPVKCTLPGCNQAMTRGQLDGHLVTWDMREVQCRHCDAHLPFRHLYNHVLHAENAYSRDDISLKKAMVES